MNIDDLFVEIANNKQLVSMLLLIEYLSPLHPSDMHLMILSGTLRRKGIVPQDDMYAKLDYFERRGLIETDHEITADQNRECLAVLVRQGKLDARDITFGIYASPRAYHLSERGKTLVYLLPGSELLKF